MKKQEKKEVQKILLDIYADNQKFIDKVTITAALGFFPLAISQIDRIQSTGCFSKWLFILACGCSLGVVVSQIIGAIYGKKSCDAGLAEEKDFHKYSNLQDWFNNIVNICFIAMIVLCCSLTGYLVFYK